MNETTTEHTINGWTFKIRDDAEKPLPWVYQNVKNYGSNFATEISVEKIIVEVEKNGKLEPRSLNFSDFETLSGEQPTGLVKLDLKAAKYSLSVSNFAVYQGNGLLLELKTKKDVLPAYDDKGEPIDEPLYLVFTILFSEYGNDPPHEFSGALPAARFTPALRFETMNDTVRAIRVHYRFHFDLDSYLQDAPELTKWVAELKEEMWGIENYASVIRDADHFPPSVLPAIKLLKDVFAMFEELKFFNLRLKDCEFGEGCRSSTARLELNISESGKPTGDQLNISFRDPRTSVMDTSKAFEKTFTSLTDEKVGALSVASPAEYDQSVVENLAAKIFEAIVGPAKTAPALDTFAGQIGVVFEGESLPGMSDVCLRKDIKFRLVQLIIRIYLRRKAADLSKQWQSVREKMSTDLADVLKYLEPNDFPLVFDDIASLIRDLPYKAFVPVELVLFPLREVLTLTESIRKLAGKILSIVSFDAAEKPVLYEMVGTYIQRGEVTDTWDNLHWWGTEELPSSPGAFHAVHSHYRWTQINAYPTADEAEVLERANAFVGTRQPLHLGAPQLRSLVEKFAANKLSGPLIDPNIPNQTISFALALKGGALDEELKKSDWPFERVSVEVPQEIAKVRTSGNSGNDIVYWLSCKAVRKGKDIFRGTLLVNGFYFAHDEEKPFSFFQPANMFDPTRGVALQKPRRKAHHLFRSPFD